VIGTATANSVKAPGRSYRRVSLRASLPPVAAVLASPGRRRATGPFHSHPCRLVNQSVRAGMKGATRSTRPGRSKHRRPGFAWAKRTRSEAEARSEGRAVERVGAFTLLALAVQAGRSTAVTLFAAVPVLAPPARNTPLTHRERGV